MTEEKILSGDQMEMIINIREGMRTRAVGGTKLIEDAIQASFSNVNLIVVPGFRLAFDGGNTKLAPSIARKEFFRRPS